MEKKEGLLSSLRAKVWAGVMSGVAAIAGSSTLYFWKEITGQAETPPAQEQRGRRPHPHATPGASQQPVSAQPASFKGLKSRQDRPSRQ